MKPLYKLEKKKKKNFIALPPSLFHPIKQGLLPLMRVEMIRTAYPLQAAQCCTALKEDPRHPNPEMKHCGWTASEVRQRPETALIVLISKDNKTISVLQPKHFRN